MKIEFSSEEERKEFQFYLMYLVRAAGRLDAYSGTPDRGDHLMKIWKLLDGAQKVGHGN